MLYQDEEKKKKKLQEILSSDHSKIIIEVCFMSGIFYFNLRANKTE